MSRIPPLIGEVVFAWPMFADSGEELTPAPEWQLGGKTLSLDAAHEQILETMSNLAEALGVMVSGYQGPDKLHVESVGVHPSDDAPDLFAMFTHRLHFTGAEWHGPPDWAVTVQTCAGVALS